ncbi:MAG: hypothetical protein RR740_00630 [Pseudomonas sp.]
MKQFEGRRRISFNKTKAEGYGWVVQFKQTLYELEDTPDKPFIVPSLGLRQDGHAGRLSEGQDHRRIAGYYDKQSDRWYVLDVEVDEIDAHPWYNVRIFGSDHKQLGSSGYNDLQYAFNDFIRELPREYQHDDPMSWVLPPKQIGREIRSTQAEGFGVWA